MKIVIPILFVLFAFNAWAAGTGAIDDPYTTIADMETGIAAASCGDTLYLKSGTYISGRINLDRTCTSGNELTISVSDGAAEDLGGVIFTAADVRVTGDYQILKGFYFDPAGAGAVISLEFDGGATHNRITECKFEDVSNNNGITIGRTSSNNHHNEIDHCEFYDSGSWGGFMLRIRTDGSNSYFGNNDNHIHHNVFRNHHSGGNYETIQIGDGDTQSCYDEAASNIIEYNYFHNNCSDNEMMSSKTSGNIFRYNTIVVDAACADGGLDYGCFTFRGGENGRFISNFVYSNQASPQVQGLRVRDAGHKVINNYFEGEGSGYAAIWLHGGDGGWNEAVADNVLVLNNTIKTNANKCIHIEDDVVDPDNDTITNNLCESSTASPGAYMYRDSVGTGHTFTTNLTYCPHANCDDGSSISGVTAMAGYRVTETKAGLPFNWDYPSSYTDGTYHADATVDIQGQSRANPPDIGSDESGGTDSTVAIGTSWTGSYTIQIQVSDAGVPVTVTVGGGSQSITVGGGSQSVSF
jgi:hypothetical protein